ncbi:peroxisome membrane protein [Chlamydoabsidia padenii]|nr:peroxisome membrane protein [Chlamydoabsidia padenii]
MASEDFKQGLTSVTWHHSISMAKLSLVLLFFIKKTMISSSLLHFTGSLHHYHKLQKGYTSKIEQVEDLLRALSLLLPGRVSDGDLCSQSILTTLNLVSLYNTHHLITTADSKSVEKDRFVFNQYLRHQFRRSKLFHTLSVILSVVSYSEVLLEMLAVRKYSLLRWRFISWLEGFKAFLRLVLYVGSRKSMVLHPTHFIRNVDSSTLTYDTMGEEKIELTHLDTRIGVPSTANTELLSRVMDIDIPTFHRSKWTHLAEVLWIFRPLIYVILLGKAHNKQRKLANNSKDTHREACHEEEKDLMEKDEENYWQPWLTSLAVDVLALILRLTQKMSSLEKEESKRRNYLLLFYLLRGPVYSAFIRKLLDRICNSTEHRPLISIVTTAVNDYRPFWEQSYFYTSGS